MSIERKLPWLAGLLCGALGCSGAEPEPAPAITVGLLLPFTGSASATASNLERAALYAADRINAGGGIDGLPVRVIARDTHSEVARGRRAARELIDEGALVVIGPESAEVAEAVGPLLAEARVVFLSPLVGAASEPSSACDSAWFRLAPSAKSLGEALAKQVFADGVRDIAVVYSSGAYDRALESAVTRRFIALGGNVPLKLQLNPAAQSYASEVTQAIDAEVEAMVLATSPRSGALLINEFDALSAQPPRWFLSPLLKTELLVQNVAPAALQGASGVAPKVYDRGPEFPEAFGQRWLGDEPLEGAYFYYDALGLLAVAMQKMATSPAARDEQSFQDLQAALLDAAAPPGQVIGWDELEDGLARLRDGQDLYYTGLTGPLLLEPCGSRRIGVTSSWRVNGGAIVDGAD